MDGMLSQEEINALLSGAAGGGDEPDTSAADDLETLTDEEKDALGEVSNISMGSAATALFSLLNQKVNITTPKVSYATWKDFSEGYTRPCVFVQIYYKDGIDGNNVFILKENDVKIITDLMMGGDGTNIGGELSEMHLSAISEAMNQMMGSAATSLSSMLDTRIDISPPIASLVNISSESVDGGQIADFLQRKFVKVSFQLEVGDLINSELMQLYPFDFARTLYSKFMKYTGLETENDIFDSPPAPAAAQSQSPPPAAAQQAPQSVQPAPQAAPTGYPPQGQPVPAYPQGYPQPPAGYPPQGQPAYPQGYPMPQAGYPPQGQAPMPYMMPPVQDVNIAPVQFQPFMEIPSPLLKQENIDLLLDVPLEVTVELGRTSKSIKEILDFVPGTIIELNHLAGEPIDVLVNGKFVAKGEVVVIEEAFGIRIVDIVK